MIKFTNKLMKQSLDSFGEDYKYPVYASIDCRKSCFRSYNTKAGFVAVTDTGKILIDEYYVLGTENRYIFSVNSMKSLKIRKFPLLPIYNIKSVFMADGKTFRLDMAISLKLIGCEFQEQKENTINLIETLKNLYTGGELL